jgi:hypothetical protein
MVTVADTENDRMSAFNAADIHFIEKYKGSNGLYNVQVYLHPSDRTIQFLDVEDTAASNIFEQLFGLAHKADTKCKDCKTKVHVVKQ